MPDVTRLIIADSHLGQRQGDAAEMADMVRKASAAGIGEIIYLGDSFQYLIGMSKFWTDAVRVVMGAWDEVRSRGTRVVLIEGNRDFFLDEPELSQRVDWAGRQYDFESGPVRYRVVHGDRVNLRDVQYRFWSAVSKSLPARIWARLLPRPVAVAIVTSMERRLAETNRKFRYRKPVRDFKRSAATAWSSGIDVLFWGHFHTRWECRENGRLAMVIPAWLETTGSILVEADGRWRWVGTDLEPAELPPFNPSSKEGGA
jgi:UDP-2,3-diacylglucosamine pyrophosphatase LpxH